MDNKNFIITQLIFVNEGEEKTFEEYENHVLPLLSAYNGEITYRIRPDKNSFIGAITEYPYEIHIVSFKSKTDYENYMNDKIRQGYQHLLKKSVRKAVRIEGKA